MTDLRKEFEKPLIRYGSAIILGLVLYEQLLNPWLEWRSQKVSHLRERSAISVDLDIISDSHDILKSEMLALEENFASVKPAFLGSLDNAQLTIPAEVRSRFENAGLKVLRVQTSLLTDEQTLPAEFSISLQVEGAISDFFELATEIEQGAPFYGFDQVIIFDINPKRMRAGVEMRRYIYE